MSVKLKIAPVRQKVEKVEDEIEEKKEELLLQPREEMKKIDRTGTDQSSISIPEFLTDEPYPYFYHTWNKLLLCNLNDVSEAFHINNSNDLDQNIYIFNNDLKDIHTDCSNFEKQHNKYGNSLQNYYTIVKQTSNIDSNWKEKERINITDITPIYLQKCENIMTTLLFMPLDQCHDFRGGRTTGSTSWVTEISKGILKKDVDGEQLTQGITENIYSNDFMNTLVRTSFSGKQNIVGILIIGDDSLQLLNSSEYKTGNDLDIQKIMNSFGPMVSIGGDITMNCDPRGNRLKLNIEGKDAQLIFLGFTSDGWDKGMHDVWSMNERKHVYSIKIDRITQLASGQAEVIYSGDKITTIENIVPCYEMLYKSKEEGNSNAFINNFEIDGKKITKTNFNEFFTQENFDKLYSSFIDELYRTGKEISVEEDEEEQGGGAIGEPGVLRGATYRFYGVRAPDSKTSERMTPENRGRHIVFENMFIELLKKISKSISPQIHPNFKYPDVTNILCDGSEEEINERINKVNTLYESLKADINSKYPQVYDKTYYDTLRQKMSDNCSGEEKEDERFIIKQFGTVNDMNIAPVIERVMDSLNCSDNCNIINVERIDEEKEGDEAKEDEVQVVKKKEDKFKSQCLKTIEDNIENDLNNKYPFKFQVVSGVLDSSLQGGENMPEYFPPEIDIFMSIFDNQGNLQGAVVRMTFLKVILKNTTNTKNNARVYSHFVYVGFNEINLDCEDKLGENWKLNAEKYPFALKQLLKYVVENTSFVPLLSDNLVSNFELKLKDENYKRWYFYFSDTAGPSVSEGINNIVIKIFTGQLPLISDDNIDVSESIVKVAQKIYLDSPQLREIYKQQSGSVRSYAFESIFLLKIKYIGDKSRCTDSLFLNRNKYAECMQITGDENAYFTALINGASTIYSPPSRFAFYFAPYFTYGDVENEAKPGEPVGKFLLNLPLYKETLLKGVSPSEFKISSSSSRKKTVNTEDAIPFESSLVKERGILASGIDVRNKANDIIRTSENPVGRAYGDAQFKSRTMEEVSQMEDLSKKTSKQKEIKKALDGYVRDYVELEGLYEELKETVEKIFIKDIEKNKNELTSSYYNKIIDQLRNIFIDNEFIIEPVVISKEDFELIKQQMIDFIEKALKSMKQMSSQPYSKENPPQMLDINEEPVIDKKGKNVTLPLNAYEDLKKNIPIYEKLLNSLKQIEDVEEFYVVLKELNDLYTKNIAILKGASEKVIFWNNDINKKINFIFSLSDIVNHILPNIKTAKSKFASQTNKYDKFKPTINTILSELPDFSRKKTPASAPVEKAPKAPRKKSPASAPAAIQTEEIKTEVLPETKTEEIKSVEVLPETKLEEIKSEEVIPEEVIPETKTKEVIPETTTEIDNKIQKKCLGTDCIISGGGGLDDSYRKNQIYILKCFSDLIKSNNDLYENLLTPDKSNFNYASIDTIDKYCISILMLQTYSSFNSFQPRIESLQTITNEITKLNENTSTLQDAINIRNYYSQIINTFIDIEYLQPDAIDYITRLHVDDELIVGDTIIYDMDRWCYISYYLLSFVYHNLNLINSQTITFVDNIDSINFHIISKIFGIIKSFDVEDMSGYYELSKFKNDIDKIEDFSSEDKEMYRKQIALVESYEYLCLFLVKYCNELFIRLTKNQLKYSSTGLLYNYDIINNKLTEDGLTELSSKFKDITINIGNSNSILVKLDNLYDLDNINVILQELSSVPEVEEIPLKEIPIKDKGEGIKFKPYMLTRVNKSILPMRDRYRDNVGLQAAGTFKNKKIKNNKKTRNNKTKNKKGSIKKRENKIKKNTRRT